MIDVNTRVVERMFGRHGEVVEVTWPFGTPEESPWAEPHYVVQLDDHIQTESYGENALLLEADVEDGLEDEIDVSGFLEENAVTTADN